MKLFAIIFAAVLAAAAAAGGVWLVFESDARAKAGRWALVEALRKNAEAMADRAEARGALDAEVRRTIDLGAPGHLQGAIRRMNPNEPSAEGARARFAAAWAEAVAVGRREGAPAEERAHAEAMAGALAAAGLAGPGR